MDWIETETTSRMSASCCGGGTKFSTPDPSLRRALWLVLAINAAMFAVEIGAGLAAGSASLQADALDFLGDAANYAISLFVVGMALRYRAMAALAKAATMGIFGLWVIGITIWHAVHGTLPMAFTIGAVGSRHLSSMLDPLRCCGHTATETPICAQRGSARGTTCSAT